MAELDQIMRKYIRPEKGALGGLQGAAFIVKDKNGTTLYSIALGKLNFESNSPPFTADSVCWIASNTKLITAVCILQLVEKGMIGLDDDVGKIVPELSNMDVITGFDDSGAPVTTKQSKPITLRHLLTHSSGLAYDAFEPKLIKWAAAVGRTVNCNSHTREGFTCPLIFQPGDGWVYGVGTDWAGIIIETLTGGTLGDYMQNHIFTPLGMSSTTFHVLKRSDLDSRRAAWGLRTVPRGALTEGGPLAPLAPRQESGGAGLYSTANDYAKLLSALLTGASGLLKPESVRELYKPLLPETKYLEEYFYGPAYTYMCQDYPKGLEVNWGLGGAINMEAIPGRRSKGSIMWSAMANSHWWWDPEMGIAATLVTQVLPPGDAVVVEMYDALERTVYKEFVGRASSL